MNGTAHTTDIAPRTSVTFLEWDGHIEIYVSATTGDELVGTWTKATFMDRITGFAFNYDGVEVRVSPEALREAQATFA